MENNTSKEQMPRVFGILISLVLFVISGLFLFLFIVLAYKGIENDRIDRVFIVVELIFGLISYSLAILSYRLLTNRGRKKTNYLFSNIALTIWGTIFGVAGVVEIIMGIFYKNEAAAIWGFDSSVTIIMGVISVFMGIGVLKLVKTRKQNAL